MKLKKADIIRFWNNSELRKKYKRKLNYKNWVEFYNEKAEIIGGVLFRDKEKITFYININENGKIIKIKDTKIEEIGG
jgi:hypothetical protein